MGKIISFYNHKGGVGKTTLVYNLSFALADLGMKVLTVDADPQMNLTSSMYGLSTSVEYSLKEGSRWQKYTSDYISIEEYLDKFLAENDTEQETLRKESRAENGKYIDFISGAIRLSKIEFDLYKNLTNPTRFTEMLPYRFEQSVREPAKEYDFVLIDLPPSATSIVNALYVMSCDYFIVPVSPTFFSLQAIDNLSEVVRSWSEILSPYRTTMGNKGLSFNPKFLGIVVQLAKRFASGAREYSKSTESWAQDLNESIRKFVDFAAASSRSVTEKEFKRLFPKRTPFIIEKCCDFTPKLRSIAEKEGVPVIYLTDDICKKHDKQVNIKNKQTQYSKAFNSIGASYREIAKNLTNLDKEFG
uniref:Cellulose biosynthesis protein BcsQ n=1 Tax=Candidatus Kentrum sp. TC TaxID=2126339 RepID=A0A450YP69_9GAMM|nr:MAG: Cellulose biosynthesis protein BcsQ [Candidatus Kentron sp. TC]VFK43289.1 MAG: Cellulose biosynthesis protein BcsQ [Candidatus Kentron sp. TC]VFK56932.1 MAG: Cellulose biosynthesis protein BcsQ [Candidatus Kentron sp. TC]